LNSKSFTILAPITALALTKDDRYIIIGSTDRSIKIFDFQKRQPLFTFENVHEGKPDGYSLIIFHLAPINSVAISRDKLIIASACYDGSYHILGLSDTRLLYSFKTHKGRFLFLADWALKILNREDYFDDHNKR